MNDFLKEVYEAAVQARTDYSTCPFQNRRAVRLQALELLQAFQERVADAWLEGIVGTELVNPHNELYRSSFQVRFGKTPEEAEREFLAQIDRNT